MLRNFRLDAPATRADVIGWTLSVPVSAWLLWSVPGVAQLPEKYGAILGQFDQPLPPDTRLILEIGGPGLAAAYVVLALLPVAVLLVGRRPLPKIAVPLAIGAAGLLLNTYIVFALAGPILSWGAALPN